MSRNENPPFGRGETYFEGQTVTAAMVTESNYLLGFERQFEDLDLSDRSTQLLRSPHPVTVRAVRNISGAALLPKRLATFAASPSSGCVFGTEVDGMVDVSAEGPVYPIDEWLPTTGCPDDDICWIVIDGPATVLTALEGDANNVFSVGTLVCGLTAATSGATTAGRVKPCDFTGATSPLAQNIINRLGRAMSAKTTANTNADLLVLVTRA